MAARLLLSLLLFAQSAAQAAPTVGRAVSGAPGRLPAPATALSAAAKTPSGSLAAPSLESDSLPTLAAPLAPNAAPDASPAAAPALAAPLARLSPVSSPASAASPVAAPAAAPTTRSGSPIFARSKGPANNADDAPPAAKDTAEALAENAPRAPLNALQRRMARAFDGGPDRPLHVLMTAGEANPYIKTGGLADVIGDVSPGLVKAGHKVSLVIPLYASIKPEEHGLRKLPGAFAVPVGDRIETARLWTKQENGVDVYFVEHEEFFGRRGAYGYQGKDYEDNDDRFIFHARAALEAMRFLDAPPDIVHAHDWHVGLIPPYLKLVYDKDPFFAATRSVMTIHNIAYQGTFGRETVEKAGFKWEDFTYDKLEYHGNLSFLKAGVTFADAVTTVSPTYAEEIRTGEFGMGLEGLLAHRRDDTVGILNGIDPNFYNPKTDDRIEANYDRVSVRDGKRDNKRALQSRLGLAHDPNAPVFGIASRLAHQKGIDLVAGVIDFIIEKGGQVVVTGSGEPELESRIDELVKKHPGRVFRHAFDTVFVHMVYAVSDFLLMPSRFEPCGLSQMMAHAYGGLPIATRTGGLADTIVDLDADPDAGNGYFVRDFTVDALKEKVAAAFKLYDDRALLERAQRRAMSVDHSWQSSLVEYYRLYRAILTD